MWWIATIVHRISDNINDRLAEVNLLLNANDYELRKQIVNHYCTKHNLNVLFDEQNQISDHEYNEIKDYLIVIYDREKK